MFKELLTTHDGRRTTHDGRRTTDDGHPVTLKAPLEHVVLRWAKNDQKDIFLISPWIYTNPALWEISLDFLQKLHNHVNLNTPVEDWLYSASIVFQLYRCGHCTCPCFPGVFLTRTPHNILWSHWLLSLITNVETMDSTPAEENSSKLDWCLLCEYAMGISVEISVDDVWITHNINPCFFIVERVEQDQTAHTCSLILLYILRYFIRSFNHTNPV